MKVLCAHGCMDLWVTKDLTHLASALMEIAEKDMGGHMFSWDWVMHECIVE
jgi:hypothetical protein